MDPVSLALVASVTLTEGIKFLYGQASKIIERWVAREDAAKKGAPAEKKKEAANVQLPDAFDGQLTAPEIDFDEVEKLSGALLNLRSKLVNYADGPLSVDKENKDVLEDIDSLRLILESIYQQRLTFKGENREKSGTKVTSRIVVKEVKGKLTVLQIGEMEGGSAESDAHIETIDESGEVIVTNIEKLK